MDTYLCKKCGAYKQFSEMAVRCGKVSGRCKNCYNERMRKYRKENIDKILAANKRYNEKNPEKVKAWAKKARDENRKDPEWVKKRKEYITEYQKTYSPRANDLAKERYRRDLDSSRKKSREKWLNLSPKSLNARREYERSKYREDDNYRLASKYRARVRRIIRENKCSPSTQALIGCDKEKFRSHIESLFEVGMNWDNYGKWEMDHIQPCVSFDLTDVTQAMQCFNFSNTRPCWKTENRSQSRSQRELRKKG